MKNLIDQKPPRIYARPALLNKDHHTARSESTTQDGMRRRLLMILGVAWLAGMAALLPEVVARDASPRPVTPRGPLAADEASTIELFERTRDSVAYITTSTQVRDFWSRNVFSVPRG